VAPCDQLLDASVVVCPVDGAELGAVVDAHSLPPAAVLKNGEFARRCDEAAAYCATHSPTREEHWAYRQRWPHAHCVVTEPYVAQTHFVVDLGEDCIYHYGFDDVLGAMHCRGSTQLERAVGPRHLVFHATKRCAYVVNELISTVSAFKFDAARAKDAGTRAATHPDAVLRLCATSTTLPGDYDNAHRTCPATGIWKAKSHAAEIRIDGDWLYVANRGHDSLAVFKLTFNADDEPELTLAHVEPTQGKCPRNYAIVGGHVVVGNQDSNELRVFKRCLASGALTSVSTLTQSSPNFITELASPLPPLEPLAGAVATVLEGETVAVDSHVSQRSPLKVDTFDAPDAGTDDVAKPPCAPSMENLAKGATVVAGFGVAALAALSLSS